MTTVQLTLPDDLAAEAQEAGLLSGSRLENWLWEQVRQHKAVMFVEAMDRMASAANEAGLTPDDLAEEIRAMRAEKRRSAA